MDWYTVGIIVVAVVEIAVGVWIVAKIDTAAEAVRIANEQHEAARQLNKRSMAALDDQQRKLEAVRDILRDLQSRSEWPVIAPAGGPGVLGPAEKGSKSGDSGSEAVDLSSQTPPESTIESDRGVEGGAFGPDLRSIEPAPWPFCPSCAAIHAPNREGRDDQCRWWRAGQRGMSRSAEAAKDFFRCPCCHHEAGIHASDCALEVERRQFEAELVMSRPRPNPLLENVELVEGDNWGFIGPAYRTMEEVEAVHGPVVETFERRREGFYRAKAAEEVAKVEGLGFSHTDKNGVPVYVRREPDPAFDPMPGDSPEMIAMKRSQAAFASGERVRDKVREKTEGRKSDKGYFSDDELAFGVRRVPPLAGNCPACGRTAHFGQCPALPSGPSGACAVCGWDHHESVCPERAGGEASRC